MNFLKKYRISIILMLVLFALTFWFIPAQEKIYLKSDLESIEKSAFTFLIRTLSIGTLTILILALRGTSSWKQVGNTFIGVVALLIPAFFILEPVILFGFLLLNRIDVGSTIERQYTAALFLETNRRTPLVYDFKEQKVLMVDNLKNMDKLSALKPGDTLTIRFNKGLLGFPFDPKLK